MMPESNILQGTTFFLATNHFSGPNFTWDVTILNKSMYWTVVVELNEIMVFSLY
jgi:hypothetical protein